MKSKGNEKKQTDEQLTLNSIYRRLLYACATNQLADFIQLVELASPEQVSAMIKADDYAVFRMAAQWGHLSILNQLTKLAPDQVMAMITARHYAAFQRAAEHGHVSILNQLVELAPEQVSAMITADDYGAFRYAASVGHRHVLELLVKLAAPNQLSLMIEAGNYHAFSSACTYGHLPVLELLVGLAAPNQLSLMIEAGSYQAFRGAAFGGQLHVLERLVKLAAPNQVSLMIEAAGYEAFRIAASRGHRPILELLVKLAAPNQVSLMIEARGHEAFRNAAISGRQALVDCLELEELDEESLMIETDRYAAFRTAASGRYLAVLDLLVEIAPNEVSLMFEASGYQSFSSAFSSLARLHMDDIVNRALLDPGVFAHAEQQRNYGERYVNPFVQNQLTALRALKTASERENPDAMFDIDETQARLCFYMIRNLIRRNQPDLLDDICFLLAIPAVQAIAHAPVTRNAHNELLRLALTAGHHEAADVLLAIPEVRALAEGRHFYRQEVPLPALERDRESSMRALSTGEQKRLNKGLEFYQPIMTARGVESLFIDFKKELESRFLAHPAQVKTGDRPVIDLPIFWDDWKKLAATLSPDEQIEALKAYYQHKDHSALRYLSRPNQWIAKGAPYAHHASNGGWAYFEDYKQLITTLWLAAGDKESVPTDGFTLEGRVDYFINELAYLGRAHNWDETRTKTDETGKALLDEDGNPIQEEFDDNKPDNPSCYSGVLGRLSKAILGHRLFKFLTLNDIKQELRGFVREHFIQQITDTNRAAIYQAWSDFGETGTLSETQKARFAELNLPEEKQISFLHVLSEKYLAQFKEHPEFKRYIEERFKLTTAIESHAVNFATETQLDVLLKPHTLATSASITQAQIKATLRLRGCEEIGGAVIAEIERLKGDSLSQRAPSGTGSQEKLLAIIRAINRMPELSTASLCMSLLDEQSELSKLLFIPLSLPAASAAGGSAADTSALALIRQILDEFQVKIQLPQRPGE